jgi:hypothetical protein
MNIGIFDILSVKGNELARDIASDAFFYEDKLIPLSEKVTPRGFSIRGKNFEVKKIEELEELEGLDALVVFHDTNLEHKIDIFKKNVKHLIEVLSPDVGKNLFVFDAMKEITLKNKNHFWVPHSLTIALVNICTEISKISKIKSIFTSGYNSVSNGKDSDSAKLYNDTRAFFEASIDQKQEEAEKNQRQAFNCIPIIGSVLEDNSTDLESKIEKECQYFFQENQITVSSDFTMTVNLVQVPVFRGDAYFVKIDLERDDVGIQEVLDLFEDSDKIFVAEGEPMTQADIAQIARIFISRIKCSKGYISFYLTLDNIKVCLNEVTNILKTLIANQKESLRS